MYKTQGKKSIKSTDSEEIQTFSTVRQKLNTLHRISVSQALFKIIPKWANDFTIRHCQILTKGYTSVFWRDQLIEDFFKDIIRGLTVRNCKYMTQLNINLNHSRV